MAVPGGEISILLKRLADGDEKALEPLIPLVYRELHRLAAYYMRGERKNHTLQPTALVHEAYLRLLKSQQVNWQGKSHFFGVAAQVMRRILTDHARTCLREKRGGHQCRLSLDQALLFTSAQSADLLAVDESLARLARFDARQSQIVELRFFGGLSVDETAAVLGISPKTVKRDWSVARAWLFAELKQAHGANA
jgi:RNA polymerase sigma factor (TIGR02999 family)